MKAVLTVQFPDSTPTCEILLCNDNSDQYIKSNIYYLKSILSKTIYHPLIFKDEDSSFVWDRKTMMLKWVGLRFKDPFFDKCCKGLLLIKAYTPNENLNDSIKWMCDAREKLQNREIVCKITLNVQ